MNSQYLYDNVMNPGHDFLYAVRSTIYILGSRAAGIPGNTTFYLNNNSSILFFSYVHTTASTGLYKDSNFPLTVSPLTCSTYVLKANDFVYSALREVNVSEGEVNNETYSYYLLTDFMKGSNEIYTGNYVFAIYNLTYEVALPQYNYSSMNNVNEIFHTDLPILGTSLGTRYLTMGTANSISLNISLIGCVSMEMLLEADINLGNGKLMTFLNKTESVNTPTVNVIASDVMIPYLNEKRLTITVHLLTTEPTYSGQNLTFLFAIPLFQNVMLNTSSSYMWLRDQSELLLTIDYTLNTGPFNFTISTIATITTTSNLITTNRTYLIDPEYGNGQFSIIFNVASLVKNASLLLTVTNNSLMLENATSNMNLKIGANSSFYPNSTVIIKVTGLPAGMLWTIVIGNASYSSQQSGLTISIPNGIYNYSFLQVPGYFTAQHNGTVAAINKEEFLNVSFEQYLYEVTVRETGLSGNSTWRVIFGNQTIIVNESSATFYFPNGTYNVRVSSSAYRSENNSYLVFIAGTGVFLQIVFIPIDHKSLLSTVISAVYSSPFSYIIAIIAAFAYVRFYRGSARICSTCLEKIPRTRIKCQNCSKKKN